MLHFWFQILKNRNDRGGYEHNMKHNILNNIFLVLLILLCFVELSSN